MSITSFFRFINGFPVVCTMRPNIGPISDEVHPGFAMWFTYNRKKYVIPIPIDKDWYEFIAMYKQYIGILNVSDDIFAKIVLSDVVGGIDEACRLYRENGLEFYKQSVQLTGSPSSYKECINLLIFDQVITNEIATMK